MSEQEKDEIIKQLFFKINYLHTYMNPEIVDEEIEEIFRELEHIERKCQI